MKFSVLSLFVIAASASGPAASAATVFSFDSLVETKSIDPGVSGPFRLSGGLVGAGAIDNEFEFVATSTSMSLALGWLTAPAEVRTLGVNLDLLDGSSNVIATDTFGGVTGTQANSTLVASGLTIGATYRLLLSGNSPVNSRYAIDIVEGVTPPPAPSVVATVPPAGFATFDTLRGTKVYDPLLAPGDLITIDGDIFRSGLLTNEFTLIPTGTELSAGIGWLVTADASRLVGVNVDLFDNLGSLVATDLFLGLTGSQAFSQISATGLTPFVPYTLKLTGNVIRDGRYVIDLLADDDAPDFRPIEVAAIPLPAGIGLLAMAIVFLGFFGGRNGLFARKG